MFEFYKEICKVKEIERKGWNENIKILKNQRIESVAEHSFSLLFLALNVMKLENLKLDENKVLKMSLYHDLCEIFSGDISPNDNISKQEKFELEFEAVKKVSKIAGMEEYKQLWIEYEQQITPESKFVKAMDKLDTVLQAKIYAEKSGNYELFQEFYNSALPYIIDYVKYI